jgi:hypothetical protein
MRCLNRDVNNRFPDADSVVAALKTGEVSRRPRTSRRMISALTAGLLVCAVGGTLAWREWRPQPENRASGINNQIVDVSARPAVAVLGFRNLTGREDSQWLSLAIAEMLTTELAATETHDSTYAKGNLTFERLLKYR